MKNPVKLVKVDAMTDIALSSVSYPRYKEYAAANEGDIMNDDMASIMRMDERLLASSTCQKPSELMNQIPR